MHLQRSASAVALFVALAAIVPSLHAQQQTSPFSEVLEVSLTNVDVVVTGKDGKPVTGLKPADFEVFEDGKRQEITNFAETGSGAEAVVLPENATAAQAEAPAPAASRKFVFYIDDSSLSMDNRRAIFPAVRKFLSENLRSGDEAMVVRWNHELKVVQPWTADLGAIDAAFAKLEREGGNPYLWTEKLRVEQYMTKLEEEASDPSNKMAPGWGELESAARQYAENYRNDFVRSTNALARLLASLSGVDGKKVLVIATDTLPTLAGAELFEHLENIRIKAMTMRTTLKPGAAAGSRVTNASRYDVQQLLTTLARAANATGVTIYGLNPKGLGGPASGKTELQMFRDPSLDGVRIEQSLAGIKYLANTTGGVAMIGAPADMALARISHDLDSYYSLGYRSTPGTSQERKIEVRSKVPGVRVRTRSNVFYRTLQNEMADRVIANQLQATLPNELGISLESDAVTTSGDKRLLPVRVVIPFDRLTLLPDANGNMTGGFSVFTCAGDGSGATSGVNVQSQAVQFTAEQAAQMQGRRIGFAIQVPVDSNRNQVSVGVVDHVSHGQGFATLKAAL